MIGAIIYAALAADSTITGLVGTRIYPEEAPNETDLPQIVYAVKGGEIAEGTVPMWPCTVTANCYAEDDAQAETIGQVFRRRSKHSTRSRSGSKARVTSPRPMTSGARASWRPPPRPRRASIQPR